MRVRELEEEGWTTAFTDGSGLNDKAAGRFCSNPSRLDKERQPDMEGSGYLGTKATNFDGELEGIALALEKHTEANTNLLAILTDSKQVIRALEKLDSGAEAPRSAIEARIQKTLETRENNQQETYITWVKGHKDIKGNEKADKLSKETSILGYKSEGAVTPAGLRAWARRERAKARGGSGQGIQGWHRKAISAHTWCVTEKGPQNKWLHKIKKSDTPACRCQQEHPPEQTGEHLAERCRLLTRARSQVERKELLEWRSRHARNKIEKKEKGPAEPGKEEEEDKLGSFFCHLYEFHNPVQDVPAFVPAELPRRYSINFVPAVPVAASSTISSISSSISSSATDYSIVSSTDFAVPNASVAVPVAASPAISPSISSSAADYSIVSSINFVVPIASVTASSLPAITTSCIDTTQ